MRNWSEIRHIVVLTGAGISAESGVKTFRDSNGLWENHRIEDVATPEAFARQPGLVLDFYNKRRAQLFEVKPNPAHLALSEWERAFLSLSGERSFLVVTQNVDDLHDRAGSKALIHMHGELRKLWCLHCDHKWFFEGETSTKSECVKCGRTSCVRPDIVWFGEMPYHMDEIERALERCDLFLSVGTSGQVYPAAGFVQWTPETCTKIEINSESTAISRNFDEHLVGPASVLVPDFVDQFLEEL